MPSKLIKGKSASGGTGRKPMPRAQVACGVCGKRFEVFEVYKDQAKFCSMKCRRKVDQCAECLEFFTSTALHEHRTGNSEPAKQRCMTTTEMMAEGLVVRNGVWSLSSDA